MKNIFALALLACVCFACSNDDGISNTKPVNKTLFTGYVQKGPYVNGSAITITTMDEHFNQTGNVYTTQIIDNSGNFEQRDIKFASNYIEMKAEGYYFNEVDGDISNGILTLYALADINDVNSVNVNILTHLQRQRILYLIQNDKLSFDAAKTQATKEVLNIFKFNISDDVDFETLNLADNTMLLAASIIMQGYQTTGEMSELLANISADIRTDGTLDNPVLGSQLMDNVKYLDLNKIIANMDKKYKSLGIALQVNLNDLTGYIDDFKKNSGFSETIFITYPENGKYGLNILSDSITELSATTTYHNLSFCAEIPKGANLKVIVYSKENFYFTPTYNENWNVSRYAIDDNTGIGHNIFSVNESGKKADVHVLIDNCYILFDLYIEYYEGNSETPTKVKTIKMIK